MVEKLILVSPIGMSGSYLSITTNMVEDLMQYLFFKSEMTAPTFYRYLGLVGSYLFNYYVTQDRFKGLTIKVDTFLYL